MRNVFLVILALVLVLAIHESARPEECQLQYGHLGKPCCDGVHASTAKMEVIGAPPKGLALPPAAATDAIVCKWKTPMVKDGFLYVAFVKSGKSAWRDRAVVDTNCDGKLADETLVEAFMTQGKMDMSFYGPVEVKFPVEGGTSSYHATFGLQASPPTAWARSSCWHECSLTLDGVTYLAGLIDGNVNGAFDDASMDPDDADFLAFPSDNTCEHRRIGKFAEIGGKLYNLTAARDGSRIELAPAGEVATGKLRTKGLVTSLMLAGVNGELPFDMVDNKTAVPAGKWMVKAWDYAGNDAEGKAPAFGDYHFGTRTLFEVTEGKEVLIDIGASSKPVFNLAKAEHLGGLGADMSDGGSLGRRFAGASLRPTAPRGGGGGG